MKYLVTISCIILICTSCNPAKRLARQQKQFQEMMDEYIKDHPQRIDTVTNYIPGLDSIEFYQHKIDSLKKLQNEKFFDIEIQYKDTCTTAVDQYSKGFYIGYEIGVFDGRLKTNRVDTIIKNHYPFAEMERLRNAANEYEKRYLESNLSLEKQKNKTRSYLMYIIGLGVFSLLITILTIKQMLRP